MASASGMTTALIGGPRPQSRNIRNPIREKYRREILEDVRYIFNITPQGWGPIYRTHSVTQILPNDPELVPDTQTLDPKIHFFGEVEGVKFSRTTIHGRIELVESGIESGRGVLYDEVATEADLIAADIVDYCNNDFPRTEDGVASFSGVFSSDKEYPTKQQVREGTQKLHAYAKALVGEADRIESDKNPGSKITTTMKNAWRMLKAMGKVSGDKPWVYDPTPPKDMVACPACTTNILPGAVVCPNCRAILNEKEARKYFPERFKVEEPKQKVI